MARIPKDRQKGARIPFSGGKHTVADGPFTEASRKKRRANGLHAAAADGDVLEIRQVDEASDFGPEVARKEARLFDDREAGR